MPTPSTLSVVESPEAQALIEALKAFMAANNYSTANCNGLVVGATGDKLEIALSASSAALPGETPQSSYSVREQIPWTVTPPAKT